MSMRIDQFIANLSEGGARPNLFRVEGQFPASIGENTSSQLLQFHCKASSIPPSTLGTIQLPFRGRYAKLAGDRVFDPWNITIINEAGFPLRNAFEKWSESINGNLTNVGLGGTGHRFIAYKQRWLVTQLDRNGLDMETYILHDCWPQNIGPISLSFDTTNTIEEFDVTLEYQYFTHSYGSPSRGRATGG